VRNALYYGENLGILRKHIPDESVDLIYLDPPFSSQRSYNVLFKEQTGEPAEAQVKAFTDTWKWHEGTERTYVEFCEACPRPQLVDQVQGFVKTLGRNEVTAYLVMMAPRLVELHHKLRPTGSLYLHCDPAASHYLKIMLDLIFGPTCFQNEVIWKRTSAHSSAKRYGPVHDVLLFYTKSDAYVWNQQYTPHDRDYVEKFYRNVDAEGRRYTLSDLTAAGVRHGSSGKPWRGIDPAVRGNHWKFTIRGLEELDREGRIHWPAGSGMPRYVRYLDEVMGVALQDVFQDISPVGAHAKERLHYQTQKPLALLERIISASSKPGDTVLDPFCGCGTAIIAAQKLGRGWIGIDITCLATSLIKSRLADSFELKEDVDYTVVGEPTTTSEARELARKDRDEFQKWAISLVYRARPYQDRRGADTGIDGVLGFQDDATDPKKCVIQVKSGRPMLRDIRDFAHVVDREKATLGFFITLDRPTRPMTKEAGACGFYTTPLGNRNIPRLQIRTVEELLGGRPFDLPVTAPRAGIKRAEAIKEDPGQQELAV